ncbi:unnamed protein product, partial [Rotaria sordida]
GIRSASLIHREANIPLSTIYYNIDKLKQTGALKHRDENGRPRVLGGKEKKAIGQYVRYNNEITLNKIKEKLSEMHYKSVSTSIMSRHLHEYGYKNVLPQSTHMLTSDEKQQPVQWTNKHINDDFNTTIFIDESSFSFFNVPQLLDWPSNSPDANPIENIWSMVKRNVEKRKPTNTDELELFLAEEFENIDANVVKNCVMSMKKRCLSLIDGKGE